MASRGMFCQPVSTGSGRRIDGRLPTSNELRLPIYSRDGGRCLPMTDGMNGGDQGETGAPVLLEPRTGERVGLDDGGCSGEMLNCMAEGEGKGGVDDTEETE